MSCCDNSEISLHNDIQHDLKILDVSTKHGKISGFKRGDIVRNEETKLGTASSTIGSRGRASGTIVCTVVGLPFFEMKFSYDFEPADKSGSCPCSAKGDMKANTEQIYGGGHGTDGNSKGLARVRFAVKAQDAIPPPRIDPKRWIANAPQDGPWQPGNRVRYAVMFYKRNSGPANDGTFHWSDWITIGAWAFPTVVGIAPSLTDQVESRVLYREIEGYGRLNLVTFKDNTITEWVDKNTSFGPKAGLQQD